MLYAEPIPNIMEVVVKILFQVVAVLSLVLAGCGAPVYITTQTCQGIDGGDCVATTCEIWRKSEGRSSCSVEADEGLTRIRTDIAVEHRRQRGTAYAEVDPVAGYATAGVCADTVVFSECAEVDTRERIGE